MKKYYAFFAVLGLLVACQGKNNPSDDEKPFQFGAVDLGLSVKWANANLGAVAPEGYGDYYAWGETDTKANYSWETYRWCNGEFTKLTKYNTNSEYGTVDNKTVLETDDDVAHARLGGKWRIPTKREVDELVSTWDNASYRWEWKSLNGHYGWHVTYLVNNNSIFLPAAGIRSGTELKNVGTYGFYWSSSLNIEESFYASFLSCTSSIVKCPNTCMRSGALPIRPVSD